MRTAATTVTASHVLSVSLAGALAAGVMVALGGCGGGDAQDKPTDGGAPADDGGTLGEAAAADGGPEGGVDPSLDADPQDLDPTDGDPSLDIAGSHIYFDNGAPWVRVVFYGPWPPAPSLYSWACSVLLGTENAPVVTYTVQSLSGTQTDYTDGIDKAKVTFAAEEKGFRLLFGDSTLQFDRYGLECSVQKAKGQTMVQDASGAFVFKSKDPRPFGP